MYTIVAGISLDGRKCIKTEGDITAHMYEEGNKTFIPPFVIENENLEELRQEVHKQVDNLFNVYIKQNEE